MGDLGGQKVRISALVQSTHWVWGIIKMLSQALWILAMALTQIDTEQSYFCFNLTAQASIDPAIFSHLCGRATETVKKKIKNKEKEVYERDDGWCGIRFIVEDWALPLLCLSDCLWKLIKYGMRRAGFTVIISLSEE